MDIESVRDFALSLNENVTEELFAKQWISWRICGKWFLLMQLDAPEPRIAVKLPPDVATTLRDQYSGVRPAYHMNKTHWSDLYLNELDDNFVKMQITASYQLVLSKLPKNLKSV
ncbi:MmcQ/YjbR family DNA-binding protein [Phocaeicola sp.]